MLQFVLQNFISIVFVSLMTTFSILVLRPLAIKVSLTDIPTLRKMLGTNSNYWRDIHIFYNCLTSVIVIEHLPLDTVALLACAGLSLLLGAADDKFDLGAFKKLGLQTAIALTFVISTGHVVTSLGSPISYFSPARTRYVLNSIYSGCDRRPHKCF